MYIIMYIYIYIYMYIYIYIHTYIASKVRGISTKLQPASSPLVTSSLTGLRDCGSCEFSSAAWADIHQNPAENRPKIPLTHGLLLDPLASIGGDNSRPNWIQGAAECSTAFSWDGLVGGAFHQWRYHKMDGLFWKILIELSRTDGLGVPPIDWTPPYAATI